MLSGPVAGPAIARLLMLYRTGFSDSILQTLGLEDTKAEQAPRRPNAIVDSRLHVKHDFTPANLRNKEFLSEPENSAHLANQLLLYEHLIIPTNDFGIVPALIQWLGIKNFEESLENGTLSFLRRRGFLAYVGNGNGISDVLIEDTRDKPFEWWQGALFGELGDAVELQLVHSELSLAESQTRDLAKKIVAASTSVIYPSDGFFIKNIANESYTDIHDTPELKASLVELLRADQNVDESIALNRIPGVAPNQVRIAGDGSVKDAVDLVMRVAEINLEIFLAEFAGGADLHVSAGAEKLLKQKVLRVGSPPPNLEGFTRLLELNGIPDIGHAVRIGTLSLEAVMRLRRSRSGKRFREWLAKAEAASAPDLEHIYRETLQQSAFVESWSVKTLRIGIPLALGFPHPFVAAGAGLLDSLFTEKYLKGYRPKLMFDELRKLFAPATVLSLE
jgi:hypothetical protein